MESEGFKWWFGRVEDREDPEQLGRVRVRVFNLHGDEASMPTSTLRWSPVIMPVTNAGQFGIGRSPTGIQVGTIVWGCFLDGAKCQDSCVLGVWLGKPEGGHDVPALARGTNTIKKEPIGPEPESAYHARYPYNNVTVSESGHVVEVDDTPNFERLHTYHRSGTYTEIDAEGRRVNKIVGNDFEIIEKDKTVYVQGNVNIVVKGNATIEVEGGVNLSAPNVDIDSPSVTMSGDLDVTGTVTAGTDVLGGGISLKTHVHGGVQSGGSTTGLPQ